MKQMLSNTLRLNFWDLKIIHMLHSCCHPKIIEYILKKSGKDQVYLFSWGYTINHNENGDESEKQIPINRPRSRHGRKYSKYKKCFIKMMLICIKQHLSNTWRSIHKKIKQHWVWVEKGVAYVKKACNRTYTHFWNIFDCYGEDLSLVKPQFFSITKVK